MKKIITILLLTSLILTGCAEKQETTNNNPKNEVENVETPEEKEEIETPEKKDEEKVEDNEEKKEETPKKDNVTSSTSKTETPKKEETVKPEVPSCKAKKFNKKYSYAYKTKEECISKGNDAFMNVYENIDDSVFTYGCNEIVDDCGTTWYGVYFNVWTEEGSVEQVYY